MNQDCKERLRACFRAVFPDATNEEIEAADVETTEAWDSIAQATLVSLVEEEFGVTVPADQMTDVTSSSQKPARPIIASKKKPIRNAMTSEAA